MLSPDVLMRQPLRFLRCVCQYALAFVAQRQINRRRNLFPDRGMTFNLLADGFNRGMRAQKSIGQGLVFAQKSQQQVLGLNIWRPKLAGFIAREKDNAPCFLRITFEHIAPSPRAPLRLRLSRHPQKNSWPYTSLCNQEATKQTP